VHDLRPVEHASLLLGRQSVVHVRVLEDVLDVAARGVLSQKVRRDVLFGGCLGEEEREGVAHEAREPQHHGDCIVGPVQVSRVVHGVDDAGNEERVVIWIERKPGGVWAVGRAVNGHLRNDKAPRRDDYIFEGYELEDALEQANSALEDDLTVSESDGRPEHLRPFTRDELLKPLEAWFFGREQ
jgi:hypothetical protein